MRSLFLAALLAAPSPLFAHAVLEPAAATPGAAYEGAVRIGHGCDGRPTREVRLTLPAGLTAPRALPLPGWETTVEGAEIVWRGTLAPDAKALFPFAAQVAADAPAMIDLAVAQICDGARIDWNGADADHPAPMLHLAGGAAPAHHHHGAEAAAPGGAVALAPGGLHLMLLGLRQPLAEGATLPLTLVFETAGEVTLDLPVLPRQPKP